MVNRDFLAKMRRGSYLINTSRGGLVVETDLRDALVSGHLAGAGLDVLNHEPPEPGNPLLGLPNVVFSPHIAGTDTQSMREMAELAATTIVELSPEPLAGGLRRQFRTARRLAVVSPSQWPWSVVCSPRTVAVMRVRRRAAGRRDTDDSDLERAAAAAALDDVGVVEDEPPLLQAVVVIDDGAVEVGVELLVDGQRTPWTSTTRSRSEVDVSKPRL